MSGEARVDLTGGCQCGAVRYRLAAWPTGENVCPCRMRQKAGGGPFMAFAGVRVAELSWTRGTPRAFASSGVAERGFCGDCGTPLTYRLVGRDRISITIGSLDRASAVTPRMQYGVESKVAWLDSIPALPEHDIVRFLGSGVRVGSRQHPDHDT
jgi:hypothetical protein